MKQSKDLSSHSKTSEYKEGDARIVLDEFEAVMSNGEVIFDAYVVLFVERDNGFKFHKSFDTIEEAEKALELLL